MNENHRRVALFGGVYNNYLALGELVRECRASHVDAIFCLGDMGGFGPHPDRSFPLLRSGEIRSIAGNYDVSLAQGNEDCGCGYTDPADNHFARISYDYTFRNTSRENKKWLGTLPSRLSFALGPLKVRLCHGSPRQVNEFLWDSTSPDHLLAGFLDRDGADVLCCTHTGLKWHRELPGQNTSSTSESSAAPGTTGAPTSGTPSWNSTAAGSGMSSGRSDTITSGWRGRCATKGCRRNSWRPRGRDGGPPAWRSCPPGNGGAADSRGRSASRRPAAEAAGFKPAGERRRPSDRAPPIRQRRRSVPCTSRRRRSAPRPGTRRN